MELSDISKKEITETAKLKANNFMENIVRIRDIRNISLRDRRKEVKFIEQLRNSLKGYRISNEMSLVEAIAISQLLDVDIGTMTESLIEL